MTEDATLFLRYFFEKITQKDKKNMLIQYLKKLLSVFVDLPPQTGYVIFNYLVIMLFNFKIDNLIFKLNFNLNSLVL